MKEPFIIEINGTNQLINVSCEAEARYLSRKVNGKIKGPFSVEDYKIINMINVWLYVFGFATHILQFKARKPIGKTDIYNVLATGGL